MLAEPALESIAAAGVMPLASLRDQGQGPPDAVLQPGQRRQLSAGAVG